MILGNYFIKLVFEKEEGALEGTLQPLLQPLAVAREKKPSVCSIYHRE
jgi:hypothetical protein